MNNMEKQNEQAIAGLTAIINQRHPRADHIHVSRMTINAPLRGSWWYRLTYRYTDGERKRWGWLKLRDSFDVPWIQLLKSSLSK